MEPWEHIPDSLEELQSSTPSLEDFRTATRVAWWMSRYTQFFPDEFGEFWQEGHAWAIIANELPGWPESRASMLNQMAESITKGRRYPAD